MLPVLLAVALMTALAFRVHPGEVWDELRQADFYWVPAILAANLASDWFRALRWQQQLPADKRPPVSLLFFSSHIGSAVNFLVPLRAGEAIRVRIVSQRTGIEPAGLVATLFGEVISDLVTFSVYIAIGLALLPEATFLWPLGALAGAATLGALAGGYELARRGESWSEPAEARGTMGWLRRQFYHFALGMATLRDPRRFVVLLLNAQGTWLFETLMFYMCGRALGVDLSFTGYMLLVVTANVAGSVPITQAGFGVFELGVAGVMRALGVQEVQAATYAIFVHVLLTTPHLLYGPLAAAVLHVRPSDVLGGPRDEV